MLATERAGRVVIATLARPPVNALDGELIARLDAVVDQVTADPEIAVLHIRSDQTSFCAGADLALMRSCFTTEHRGAMVRNIREHRCGRKLQRARRPPSGPDARRYDHGDEFCGRRDSETLV